MMTFRRWFNSLPGWMNDPVWTFRHRFTRKHQYNRVETGLRPGYYERSERLLHSTMWLLCDYIDGEGGADKLALDISTMRRDHRDWDWVQETDPAKCTDAELAAIEENKAHIDDYCDKQEELLRIHHWWAVERPAARETHDDQTMRLYSGWDAQFNEDAESGRWDEIDPVVGISRKGHYEEELAMDSTDQAMLHRVVDLRTYL